MAEKVNTHPKFIEYMETIVKHPNYKGLEIHRKADNNLKWVATKKTETGKNRIKWAVQKAKKLGLENSSKIYADTMLSLHPTKKKVCQCCGEVMSLYYLHPTQSIIRILEKEINYVFNKYDNIFDIITKHKDKEENILSILKEKCNLNSIKDDNDINSVIWKIEELCRNEGKKIFSPGAMSNFPDRYDGFHSYNLCCRKYKDKGRNPENMATYTKDRRAYEYWADGNIVAANALMGDKKIFKIDSADHIGPVSLGFIHDPYNIEPLSRSANSSKRDKLTKDSLNKLISIEKNINTYPVSFFAKEIWDFIKYDFQKENSLLDIDSYRQILKENMANFMDSLWNIIETDKKVEVEEFFEVNYFKPKYEKYFKFKYIFDKNGKILNIEKRNITDATLKEYERFVRISYNAVNDYKLKSNTNRAIKPSISSENFSLLLEVKKNIEEKKDKSIIFKKIETYLHNIQKEVILKYLNKKNNN